MLRPDYHSCRHGEIDIADDDVPVGVGRDVTRGLLGLLMLGGGDPSYWLIRQSL